MMITVDEMLECPPYSLSAREKDSSFSKIISTTVKHHYERCVEYKRFLDLLGWRPTEVSCWEQIPPLHVRVFKETRLASVEPSAIIKTLTSSGTSGTGVSQIFLDSETSRRQTKALAKIGSDYIGAKRLPMLVIDQPLGNKKLRHLSARGAGVTGFSMFAKNVTYALEEDMEVNWSAVGEFCKANANKQSLIFGFTFIVWKYFVKRLLASSRTFSLEQGILIHGGGWKRLVEESVSSEDFKEAVGKATCIRRVHNYYGMVEQTGSIFLECEHGYLHVPNVADISVVDEHFERCAFGDSGVIKLCSLLPSSYPGHVILSDDRGYVVGEDSCRCGRLGKYFIVEGRLPRVEIRGCSDV